MAHDDPMRRWASGAALLVVMLVVAVDITLGRDAPISALAVLAPMVALVLGAGASTTAGAGLLALAACVGLGAYDGVLRDPAPWVRVLGVGAGSAVCWRLSQRRHVEHVALERMQEVALAAQRAILQPVRPWIGSVAFAVRYVSADEDTQVGGDLYEVVQTPHGVRVVVGDVKGKGLGAVRTASVVLSAFREAAFMHADLADVASAVSFGVEPHLEPEDFVTAVFIEMRDNEVVVVNCGHMPPLLLDTDGRTVVFDERCEPPIGLHPTPAAQRRPWATGHRLFCYTDGLTEARNAMGDFFPLENAIAACRPVEVTLDECLDDTLRRLEAHLGPAAKRDDVALLIAEQLGEPETLLPNRVGRSMTPEQGRGEPQHRGPVSR